MLELRAGFMLRVKGIRCTACDEVLGFRIYDLKRVPGLGFGV